MDYTIIIKTINMAPRPLPRGPLRGLNRLDYKHMSNPLLNSYLTNNSINNSEAMDLPLLADSAVNETLNDTAIDTLTIPDIVSSNDT